LFIAREKPIKGKLKGETEGGGKVILKEKELRPYSKRSIVDCNTAMVKKG